MALKLAGGLFINSLKGQLLAAALASNYYTRQQTKANWRMGE